MAKQVAKIGRFSKRVIITDRDFEWISNWAKENNIDTKRLTLYMDSIYIKGTYSSNISWCPSELTKNFKETIIHLLEKELKIKIVYRRK